MKLDQNISELLYKYDCVIVPDLGGFVTNYQEARIDELSHTIMPPSKAISFNAYLKNNDGLLANYIAEKENLSFEEVNEKIKEKVESFFTQLNEGERIVFNKVGILFMDSDKNIQFNPDKSVNYLLDSFGLKDVYAFKEEPVVIPATEDQEESQEALLVPMPIVEKEPTIKKLEPLDKALRVRMFRVAAVVFPLAILMGMLTADQQNNPKYNFSNLNPFKDSVAQVYEKRTEFNSFQEQNTGMDFPDLFELPENTSTVLVPLTDDENGLVPVRVKTKEAKVNTTEAAVVTSNNNTSSGLRSNLYYVVAGCFSQKKNAKKKVKQLEKKGFDATILDQHKGLYRVAYGSVADRDKALILLQSVKQNNDPQAWLLRK